MTEINRESFEAWLATQPPYRKFRYGDVEGGCAICSFIRETTQWKNAVGGALTVHKSRAEFATFFVVPLWLRRGANGVLAVNPLTITNMQRRYYELFPPAPVSPVSPEALPLSGERPGATVKAPQQPPDISAINAGVTNSSKTETVNV